MAAQRGNQRGNWTGAVLIVIGIVFLLSNLDIVDIDALVRFWPLILIAVGVRLVIRDRDSGSGPASGPPPPPP